ncbi:hypothetical protein BOTBODRAFT_28071 [Botryobasidium botryosum FD-172 SS1]|uniref:Uncharacterized protein n=1 Tax=Botryobasidium botryosum (strain FD-172 SS1) TaxID=930990 RepID=A0A067MXR4_BOTB1|nr:hypothetical protein BOTBODRAFT_28071 [Botryobasidium botryosum FD-172 SS1]
MVLVLSSSPLFLLAPYLGPQPRDPPDQASYPAGDSFFYFAPPVLVGLCLAAHNDSYSDLVSFLPDVLEKNRGQYSAEYRRGRVRQGREEGQGKSGSSSCKPVGAAQHGIPRQRANSYKNLPALPGARLLPLVSAIVRTPSLEDHLDLDWTYGYGPNHARSTTFTPSSLPQPSHAPFASSIVT